MSRDDHNERNYDENEEWMRQVAREAAHETVKEILQVQGIDIEDWREQQRDMDYLRRFRQGSEQAGSYVRRAVITVVVSGIAWALWEAFKSSR